MKIKVEIKRGRDWLPTLLEITVDDGLVGTRLKKAVLKEIDLIVERKGWPGDWSLLTMYPS